VLALFQLPKLGFTLLLLVAVTLMNRNRERHQSDDDQTCQSTGAATYCTFLELCGSIVLTVTCRTSNPEVTQGHRFDSAPVHCRVTTLSNLFTHMCLCQQAV